MSQILVDHDGGQVLELTSVNTDPPPPSFKGGVRIYRKNGEGVKIREFGKDAQSILVGQDSGDGDAVLVGNRVRANGNKVYDSIDDALNEYVGITTDPFTAQPGTTESNIVLPNVAPFNAVADDFYVDWYVASDAGYVATQGREAVFARVTKYVAATRTLTVQSGDFTSGQGTMVLCQPFEMTLDADIDAPLTTMPANFILNGSGKTIRGGLYITALAADIRDCVITDGIERSIAAGSGFMELTNVTMFRRSTPIIGPDAIHALCITGALARAHKTILNNCKWIGRVESRVGKNHWAGAGNEMEPVDDQQGGLCWVLFNGVSGSACSSMTAHIQGRFGGMVFLNATGAMGSACDVQMVITPPRDIFQKVLGPSQIGARRFSFFGGTGGLTLSPSISGGILDVTLLGFTRTAPGTGEGTSDTISYSASWARGQNFTGTMTVTLDAPLEPRMRMFGCTFASAVVTDGSNYTGSITITGTAVKRVDSPHGDSHRFTWWDMVASMTSGIPTVACTSGAWQVVGANFFAINTGATNTISLAPTITFSAALTHDGTRIALGQFNGATVSDMTMNWSGAVKSINRSKGISNPLWLPSLVLAGSWTVSGAWDYTDDLDVTSAFIANQAVGGTLTVSGAIVIKRHGFAGDIAVTISTATTNVTNTVTHIGGRITETQSLVRAFASGGTATLTGALRVRGLLAQAGLNVLNAAAGSFVSGPSSVTFEGCTINGAFTDSTGSGTFTWVGASLFWKQCHFDGVVNHKGNTHFTTIEAFGCAFNGSSGNLSISTTLGTRPTTYRLWGCSYRARIEGLTPDVLRAWSTRPAAGAVVANDIVTLDASANATPALAGTAVLDGVSPDAAAALGNPVILVKDGDVFVNTVAGVLAGDHLINDAGGANPHHAIAGAPVTGRNVGRALEAHGATFAGKTYTAVHLS
jgi:hypothetical protein